MAENPNIGSVDEGKLDFAVVVVSKGCWIKIWGQTVEGRHWSGLKSCHSNPCVPPQLRRYIDMYLLPVKWVTGEMRNRMEELVMNTLLSRVNREIQ